VPITDEFGGGNPEIRRAILAKWFGDSKKKEEGSREERQRFTGVVTRGWLPFGGRGGERGCARRFQKRREQLEVEEEYDGWGPPVSTKRKKKEKEEREGCCGLGRSVGLVALRGSGRGPNGVLHVFFCSEFFFPFSALVYLLFEVQKYFGNTLLNW
jgi:hypothetical protein